MKIIIKLISLIFLISCVGQKLNQSQTYQEKIVINTPEVVKLGEVLNIEIKNISNDTITLINPVIKKIEKFENENWRLLRILYCPCGANCQPAIPKIELLSNQNVLLNWNLNESWCIKNEYGEIQSETQPADTGLYRILLLVDSENKIDTLVKEFKILK